MGEVIGQVTRSGGDWSGVGGGNDDDDVTITVGDGDDRREFRGRRDLLTHQSGYFKSLFDGVAPPPPNERIALPSVTPDVFCRILKFVNTGYLDLTPDNIYSVLLATHLLHMPRALELCRSYLVLERHKLLSAPPPPNIVKPIPSRKYFFWPPPYFPLPPPLPPPPSHCTAPVYVPPPPPSFFNLPPQPSTSLSQTVTPPLSTQSPELDKQEQQTDNKQSSKEVLKDVACCDGPVRFKRVLNVNYGALPLNEEAVDADKSRREAESRRRVFVCGFCKHRFKSHYCFRKHTRRHLNPFPLASAANSHKQEKDMNVQYYPCKTCGSKFPSYYFVHKHRKLCHANEPNPPEDERKIHQPNAA